MFLFFLDDTSCFELHSDWIWRYMDTFRMDRNHEGHHNDAWLGLPADGNVCNKCDDMKHNDCQ